MQERRTRSLFLDGGPVESTVVSGVGEKPATLSAAIFGASSFTSLQKGVELPGENERRRKLGQPRLVERCRERVLEVGADM